MVVLFNENLRATTRENQDRTEQEEALETEALRVCPGPGDFRVSLESPDLR